MVIVVVIVIGNLGRRRGEKEKQTSRVREKATSKRISNVGVGT
jgi:hypothetical protein